VAVCTAELRMWCRVEEELLHSAGSLRNSALHHVTMSALSSL